MLRITIELIPGGIETHPRREKLYIAEIYNDCSGDTGHGNYGANFFAKHSHRVVHKTAKVTNFPRLRKNAWHLLALALKNAGYI